MHTPTRLVQAFLIVAVLSLIAACGGSGDTPSNPPVVGGDMNPGEIPNLRARATVSVAEGVRLIDAMLNPAGTELAILSSQQDATTGGLSAEFDITVYDSNNGVALRTMNAAAADASDLLDLYWGGDRISVLKFSGGAVSWDADSGAVLSNTGANADDSCLATSPIEAFDAISNTLYAGEAFGAPFVCVFDFDASTIQRRSVELAPPVAGIESMALDADQSSLWVTYKDNNANVAGTQLFDTNSFSTSGTLLTGNLGSIVAVGQNFQLYDDQDLVVQPASTLLDERSFGVSTSQGATVVAQHVIDKTRLIALPEQTYIGETAKDNERDRSFSVDGNVGAFAIDNVVQVYALTARGIESAVKPAQTFNSTLAGTLVVDSVSQSISGTCNALVEAGVGPNIIDIAATAADGSRFNVRAQNLLGFISYSYTEGEQFAGSEANFLHSTNLATNFELAEPTISTDGTNITGSTLLFQFSNEFFDLVPDTSDATGFATRTLSLDATCI